MRRLEPYWRAETGLFLGIWLVLMTLGRTKLLRDAGTLWHTVVGRRILDSRQFLATDPFSFTFEGQPWIPFQWLAECTMALVHEVAGLDGLLLATATALAALYAWLGHRLIRSGLHGLPTTLVLVAILGASSTHFLVRPHIGSLVFFAISYALIVDFDAGRINLRGLVWLVPLFVVWTNWHGAMLGGLATLVLAALGWSLVGATGRASPIVRPRQAVGLWCLVVACGLTALVNPYGLRLPATWLKIMGSPVVARLIVEHAAPTPRDFEFWAVLLAGVAYALALLSTLARWPRVAWLLPFAWFALALMRVRHAPLFGIAVGLALADLLPHTRLAAWLARPGRDLFRFVGPGPVAPARPDWRPAVVPVALVAAAVGLQASNVRVPMLGRGWASLDPATCPVELLPDLRQAERDHPGGARVFNDYELGGFLIYQTPGLKVFIDDRCEVYGDAWLERFHHASAVEPALMDGWLAGYGVDYVLVGTGSGFDRHIAGQPGWVLVRRCPAASFYSRVLH